MLPQHRKARALSFAFVLDVRSDGAKRLGAESRSPRMIVEPVSL